MEELKPGDILRHIRDKDVIKIIQTGVYVHAELLADPNYTWGCGIGTTIDPSSEYVLSRYRLFEEEIIDRVLNKYK
jgi:hypothetical protein